MKKISSHLYYVAISPSGMPIPSWTSYRRKDVVTAMTLDGCGWPEARKNGWRIMRAHFVVECPVCRQSVGSLCDSGCCSDCYA